MEAIPLSKLLPESMNPVGKEDTKPEKVKIDFSNPEAVKEFFETELPGIKPTAEDFFKGQIHAYKIAAERAKVEEAEQKKRNRIAALKLMWTPEEMGNVALQNGKAIGIAEGFDFVLDDYNKPIFDLLCLYFANDKRFEDHGIGDSKYSLSKGIWLQSPDRGTGKTILLRSFFVNKRSCFGYKHTEELRMLFQKQGFEGIDKYIGVIAQPSSAMNFYQSEAGFMYDELFGEDKVMHMGSPLLLSSYLISKLYDFSNSHKDKKWKFHCTSNSDGTDIEKIAGKTYRSRMPDMFNMIKLNGPDRRRQ